MSDEDTSGPAGIGPDDLPAVMRELFDQCVGDARKMAPPEVDFDAFVDALWMHVSAAFNLTRRDWQTELKPWPAAVDDLRGLAESLLEGGWRDDELPG